jgi:hypothetical protein
MAAMAGHVEAPEHRQLCTIELIAEGHAERCPGESCAFWEDGCILARVEEALDGRPEVAALLLSLRRQVESGRNVLVDEAAGALGEHLGDA